MGMDFALVARLLGLLIAGLGLAMSPTAAYALVYRDGSGMALLEASLIAMVLGALCWLFGFLRRSDREDQILSRRESLLTVALCWLVGAFVGAMPFWFWGMNQSATSTVGGLGPRWSHRAGFARRQMRDSCNAWPMVCPWHSSP